MDKRNPPVTLDLKCPACGYTRRETFPKLPKQVRLNCPNCTTTSVITYDNGQGELEEHYRLAKDYDEIWDF